MPFLNTVFSQLLDMPSSSAELSKWVCPVSKRVGGWNPQVVAAQPYWNRVPAPRPGTHGPVLCDSGQLSSLLICGLPSRPAGTTRIPQSASPCVASCFHTCSPFFLARPLWICSPSRRDSSATFSRKPLHPLFQLSLGFLLFPTDYLTVLYFNF